MKRGMPKIHRLPEVCFRPQTPLTCSGVSILLFTLCLILAPSTISASHSIRFHTVFDSDIPQFTSAAESWLLKKSVSLVTDGVSRMLKVSDNNKKPLIITVKADQRRLCRSMHIPANLKGKAGNENVIADFALFLRAEYCTSEDSEAVSALCSFNNRPLSGVISFCSNTLAKKDPALLVAVTSRHLISLLGLDWKIILRSKFAEKKTNCYLRKAANRQCWSSSSITDPPRLIVSSPKVIKYAKAFTGNNSFIGLPLSPNGRAWDSSVMFTSLFADSPITPHLAPWLAFDPVTLGLLDDLSWYEVQWNVFRGDKMLWGRGGGSAPKSCAAACKLGFCNRTSDAPCFQLGPRSNSCFVCQKMTRLRAAEGLVCSVESCSPNDRNYTGVCAIENRSATSNCSGLGKCLSYDQACRTKTTPTFVTKLAAKVRALLKTTSTTSTIRPTSSPVNGYRFSLRFETLDYDSVAIKYFNNITSQIVMQVSKLLGITDRQIVKVTRISKGSTIVDFIVYDSEYSAKKVFLLLQQGLHQNVFTLTLDGKSFRASEMKSYDYEITRSYLTEVIVGSTLGLVLVIGITSVVVIIVVKKVKRSASTVYPSPEAPSDGDSEFGRSNSLQTVSVASYAAIYELRRDWGSNPRPTSLRNVVVGGANIQTRTSNSEESGQL